MLRAAGDESGWLRAVSTAAFKHEFCIESLPALLMHLSSVLPWLAAFAVLSSAQIIVNTTDGPVQGLDCGLGVECFLGIPYASAQRFQDPKRLTARRDIFSATKFSDGCPQNCTIPGLKTKHAPSSSSHPMRHCTANSLITPQVFFAPSQSPRIA